jgi:hypothetical protein
MVGIKKECTGSTKVFPLNDKMKRVRQSENCQFKSLHCQHFDLCSSSLQNPLPQHHLDNGNNFETNTGAKKTFQNLSKLCWEFIQNCSSNLPEYCPAVLKCNDSLADINQIYM